jgi:hypothetical protein
MSVNDAVEAIGFDFIQPPTVDWNAGLKKRRGELMPMAYLQLKRFESRARLRGQGTVGGFETFSMLMIDFDYDGDIFDLDAVFYADQLASDNWQAWFPAEELGKSVMAVFMDIYGNESQELIPRERFRRTGEKSSRRGTPKRSRSR